ncbi:Hypothetical protein DHA2_154532 [Giardia duodenalis]|uniref:Uncharacterized protein n=1 Tax=Giardia intestinalis TaxID=5741 RepID=V6TG08_GIAIN|nr:Hypothetical protein DHA2_154532 [Giardia intestinalis]
MSVSPEDGLPKWLQEGAGAKVIGCVYLSSVVLIGLGAYITYHQPLLGLPFLVLSICFLVAWYMFEHEYRPCNLQLGGALPADFPEQGEGRESDTNK